MSEWSRDAIKTHTKEAQLIALRIVAHAVYSPDATYGGSKGLDHLNGYIDGRKAAHDIIWNYIKEYETK